MEKRKENFVESLKKRDEMVNLNYSASVTRLTGIGRITGIDGGLPESTCNFVIIKLFKFFLAIL
jgi:hypothetical protein